MIRDTVATIVSDAAVELGLGTISDVFAATDPNVVQLRTLLKSIGRRLALMRAWKDLYAEHTFATTLNTTSYALPDGYRSMVDGTAWNRTSDQPLRVVTPQQWAQLKATGTTSTLNLLFRPYASVLTIGPDAPTIGQTIAFEYLSHFWVAAAISPTFPAKNAPTLNTDVVLFDSTLMLSALKLEFRKAKGFDTTASQVDYDEALDLALSADTGYAPTVRLGGSGGSGLLSLANAPETGFGS